MKDPHWPKEQKGGSYSILSDNDDSDDDDDDVVDDVGSCSPNHPFCPSHPSFLSSCMFQVRSGTDLSAVFLVSIK